MQRTAAFVETSRIFRNKNRQYVGNEMKDLKQTVNLLAPELFFF